MWPSYSLAVDEKAAIKETETVAETREKETKGVEAAFKTRSGKFSKFPK